MIDSWARSVSHERDICFPKATLSSWPLIRNIDAGMPGDLNHRFSVLCIGEVCFKIVLDS